MNIWKDEGLLQTCLSEETYSKNIQVRGLAVRVFDLWWEVCGLDSWTGQCIVFLSRTLHTTLFQTNHLAKISNTVTDRHHVQLRNIYIRETRKKRYLWMSMTWEVDLALNTLRMPFLLEKSQVGRGLLSLVVRTFLGLWGPWLVFE